MLAILAPLAVMLALFQVLWDIFKKPRYRSVLLWMVLIMTAGTVFYHSVEGWSWVDSFYFSVITLATVGYGDLYPTTDASKLFTVAYILIGFSVFISFAGMLTQERIEIHKMRLKSKQDPKQSQP